MPEHLQETSGSATVRCRACDGRGGRPTPGGGWASCSVCRPRFRAGQIIENERGVRFKVLRDYVPPGPGYLDVRSFEIVPVSPPDPILQAASLADNYRVVES